MNRAQKTAFCGVLCALAAAALLMTLFPFATYALPAFAGLLLVPAALELGTKYGLLSYVVTALLAWLITPDMEAKVLFILFFGYYPVIQLRLNLWRSRALSWIVKFAVFNAAMIGGYCLLLFVLGLEADAFTIGGVSLPWLFLLLGNGVFWLYDVAITRMTALYRVRLHPLVRRLFHC